MLKNEFLPKLAKRRQDLVNLMTKDSLNRTVDYRKKFKGKDLNNTMSYDPKIFNLELNNFQEHFNVSSK